MINVMNTIFTWIGFYSLASNWFTGNNINSGSMRFTFLVGRDGADMDRGDGLWGSNGYYPRLYIRSTSGRWTGEMWPAGKLDNNAQKHVDVKLDRNEEVQYITSIYTRHDALCLALMSWAPPPTTHNHKQRAGAITGDLFRLCGYPWNHSGQVIFNEKSVKSHASCGWWGTDRGFINNFNINLDVMSYGWLKDYKNSNLCGLGVSFRQGWNGEIPRPPTRGMLSASEGPLSAPEESLPPSAGPSLTPERHLAAFGHHVRVNKELSAIDLCDSPNSWGSSFLSLDESIFCDMSTKTKVPICKSGDTDGCFVYERPRATGRSRYSIKRAMHVRGSPVKYNATYFVLSDASGTVHDDGYGY
ncbi:hypothetical protein EC991_008534 [Linnemannia zychae]|nr:hypothetical protein EC991_008534 [Linnemannia zychae]